MNTTDAGQFIDIASVNKSFHTRSGDRIDALHDVNLTIAKGSFVTLVGPSGCGKSTLLRLIGGLTSRSDGEIRIGGKAVAGPTGDVGMVFQAPVLLPWRSVFENVTIAADLKRIPVSEARRRAEHYLRLVGLQDFRDKYPGELSGGMQQRVGLARALTNDADILLMDEAYSALDPLIRVDMQTVLLDLQKELKKTVVFITHDLDEALRLGDKIAILRDGMVVQQGTGQEIVLNPADEYITAFVKEVNRGRVVNVETIMAPLSGNPEGMPVAKGTVLEVAARAMTSANQTLAHVVDEAGKPIGALSLSAIISSMVTPTSHEAKAA